MSYWDLLGEKTSSQTPRVGVGVKMEQEQADSHTIMLLNYFLYFCVFFENFHKKR